MPCQWKLWLIPLGTKIHYSLWARLNVFPHNDTAICVFLQSDFENRFTDDQKGIESKKKDRKKLQLDIRQQIFFTERFEVDGESKSNIQLSLFPASLPGGSKDNLTLTDSGWPWPFPQPLTNWITVYICNNWKRGILDWFSFWYWFITIWYMNIIFF